MARYPNILCRVNAIKPEFIVRYVENFPKEPLPSAQFYEYVERRMPGFHSRNYKQAPLQWGLYYEENNYCYPRFNQNISLNEARQYIDVWLHRYYRSHWHFWFQQCCRLYDRLYCSNSNRCTDPCCSCRHKKRVPIHNKNSEHLKCR